MRINELLNVFATVLIPVATLFVGWLIYELSRQRFRLELFERRLKAKSLFVSTLQIYGSMGGYGTKDDIGITRFPNPRFAAIQMYGDFAGTCGLFEYATLDIAKRLKSFVNASIEYEECAEVGGVTQTRTWGELGFGKNLDLDKEYEQLMREGHEVMESFFEVSEPKALSERISLFWKQPLSWKMIILGLSTLTPLSIYLFNKLFKLSMKVLCQ